MAKLTQGSVRRLGGEGVRSFSAVCAAYPAVGSPDRRPDRRMPSGSFCPIAVFGERLTRRTAERCAYPDKSIWFGSLLARHSLNSGPFSGPIDQQI